MSNLAAGDSIQSSTLGSSRKMPPAKASWTSGSEGVRIFLHQIRVLCLANQRCDRGNVRIPLDQRRVRAQAADRVTVKCPYRLLYQPAVRIHQAVLSFVESRKMNFFDRIRG